MGVMVWFDYAWQGLMMDNEVIGLVEFMEYIYLPRYERKTKRLLLVVGIVIQMSNVEWVD